MSYQPHVPTHFLLQWHITERCNLRCSHCYQEDHIKNELSFSDLLHVLSQFKELLRFFQQQTGQHLPAQITVTGGEPFARQDFLELLAILANHRQLFSFAILTNGTFIDATMAKKLRQLAPRFIQVSLEGTAMIHDRIRGEGNFAQTVHAIKQLRKQHLPILISFTAHRDNYHEFPEVARLGRQLGVNRVWADRMIPWGNGAQLPIMSPQETQTFFDLMADTRENCSWLNRNTDIALHRALQFLAGGPPYHCTAGESLLAVQANGEVYPCRRMPIHIGNVMTTSLIELYENNEILHQLRHPQAISVGCQKCFYVQVCRGGLKCLSYAVTGTPFQADPGCWLSR